MKKIKLTKNKYTIVDDEDFDFLNQFKWYFNHGYAIRSKYIKGSRSKEKPHGRKKLIYMHRFIMKPKLNFVVDHINHDTLNNTKENLRICSKTNNYKNHKKRCIYWNKQVKKWTAQITCYYKKYHIGCFKKYEDACVAYDKMAKKLYGKFAYKKNI